MFKNSMFSTLIVSTLLATSCSKSSPVVQNIVVQESTTRSWSAKQAANEISQNENISVAVSDVESYHAQNFDWVQFWNNMKLESLNISQGDIPEISKLSVIRCSRENSASFITFLRFVRPEINTFLNSLELHMSSCGSFVDTRLGDVIKDEITKEKKLVKGQNYSRFITTLYKKTNLINIYDGNEYIDRDLFIKSVNQSIADSDLSTFITMSGIYHDVYPGEKIVSKLDLGNKKLAIAEFDALVKINSLSAILSFLTIIPEEVYLSNLGVEKFISKMDNAYLAKGISLDKYLANVVQLVNLYKGLKSNATTNKSLLVFINKAVKRFVTDYEYREVVEKLRDTKDSSLFVQYLKKTFIPEFVSLNNETQISTFLDRVHYNLIELLKSQKMEDRAKYATSLCDVFEEASVNGHYNSLLDQNFIGCSRIKAIDQQDKNIVLSFYGIYQFKNSGDLHLRLNGLNGGIFDLSNTKKHNDKAQLKLGKELDGIIIPYLFKVQLSDVADGASIILPYLFEYQSSDSLEFNWNEFPNATEGYDAGNLLVNVNDLPFIKPVLIAKGGEGQKGAARPVAGKTSKFAFDSEHLELSLPFEATIFEENLRSNRNLRNAFKDLSVNKFYDISNENVFDLIPSFQVPRMKENLLYIAEKESFNCGENYKCILEKLYPLVIEDISTIFKETLTDQESYFKFDLTREAAGVVVNSDQTNGESGNDGRLEVGN